MHVLLIGAYGFIGSDVARGLTARGHRVSGVGRDLAYGRRILPAINWHYADLVTMTDPVRWQPLLAGVDAIVNASGLLQDEAGHAVQRVQADAIVALIAAVLGFTTIAGAAMGVAKILFYVFLVLFLVSLVMHLVRGRSL